MLGRRVLLGLGSCLLLSNWVHGQLERAGDRTALPTQGNDPVFFGPDARYVVSVEAAGARCAIPADFDGDGDMDIVSVSSNDNTVAWYERLADGSYGPKKMISRASNGARIVTVGDIDQDNRTDVIVASYYDHTVGWFRNLGGGAFGNNQMISRTANAAQGVSVADLDNDGDLDVLAASSGDHTVAWFENLGGGVFCEVKRIVDTNSIGVRTVIAVDLNEDNHTDLAVASKDDNSITWYRNDGQQNFEKIVIDNTATGAYSLVANDVDQDGHLDLVTAANMEGFIEQNGEGGMVSVYHNGHFGDGSLCNFSKISVTKGNSTGQNDFDWFVLSVWAGDLDLDGDIDIASASFGLLHQGGFSWYENVDGKGYQWDRHKLYITPGVRTGHYIIGADLDGDGDTDLIGTTNGDNKVQLLFAHTSCDNSATSPRPECCRPEEYWNGTACALCPIGTFLEGRSSGSPRCTDCQTSCPRPGLQFLPQGCWSVPSCSSADDAFGNCDCGVNKYLNLEHDYCEECPDGQVTRGDRQRTSADYVRLELAFVDQTKYYISDKSWYGFNFSRCEIPQCNSGFYFDILARSCLACEAGQFSPGGSVTSCKICPAGSACGPRTSVPQPCQAGNYSAEGSSTCLVSPPGYVTSIAGLPQPIACAAGTISPVHGGTRCSPCDVGSFAATDGSSECISCGTGKASPSLWTTMRQVTLNGKVVWVYTEAATGNASQREGICTCDTEARLNLVGECVPCEKGLDCPGGPDAPTMQVGYSADTVLNYPMEAFAGVDGEYSVFRCMVEAWCPGGQIGTCNIGREGPGCALCQGSLSPGADGTCTECQGTDKLLLAAVILFGLAFLAVIFFLVDKDKANAPTLSAVLILITCSLIASALQQIGVFGSLSIEWASPLSDIISMGSVLNFSVDALRFGCLVAMRPLMQYLVNIAPIGFIGSITVLFYIISTIWHHKWKFKERFPALISALGTIVLVFLIANVHIVAAPFHCLENPNGLKVMHKFPSVICFESPDHAAMMAIGMINSVLPIGFTAMVVVVVKQFPRRMLEGDARFLRAFSFMVYRFKPDYVWYILVFTTRSLMIPIVPILPNVTVQVILMVTVLSIMGWLQCRFFPWRLEVANYMDSFMCLMLLVFLTCLGFLKPPDTSQSENVQTVSYIGATVLILFLSACIGTFIGGVIFHLIRRHRKDFQFFICHHKVDASAQARLMKILLQEKCRCKVFIDSDDLKNLDTLLDTVRSRVEHLVVYLTKETLTRPWCAGEVTTAVENELKITMITCPTWVPLEPLQLDNIAAYLDLSTTNLMQFGITFDMVSEAYKKLFSADKYKTHALPMTGKGSSKFDYVVGKILEKNYTTAAHEHQPGEVLLSTNPDDDEGSAAAIILLRKMSADLLQVCPQGAAMVAQNDGWSMKELIEDSFGLVVLLGRGSLHNLQQLEAIVEGIGNLDRVVPLILPSFSFPSPAYYAQTLPTVWTHDNVEAAEAALKEFFQRIGINFSIHGSDEILGTQAKSVVERLDQNLKPTDSAKRLISLTSSPKSNDTGTHSMQTMGMRSNGHQEDDSAPIEFPPYFPEMKQVSAWSERL